MIGNSANQNVFSSVKLSHHFALKIRSGYNNAHSPRRSVAKMAVGHAFSVLCYIIQLLFVLNKILYSMDENIATEDEKLLYYKIKDSLSTINVDRNGSLW